MAFGFHINSAFGRSLPISYRLGIDDLRWKLRSRFRAREAALNGSDLFGNNNQLRVQQFQVLPPGEIGGSNTALSRGECGRFDASCRHATTTTI
jgi:hypothetical protein